MYLIQTPRKITDIIRKYLIIYYKKYNKFNQVLLLKFSMPSNQIKNIRILHSSSRYKFIIIIAPFFSIIKIIKERYYSQVLELGKKFVSTSKNMIYEFYPNQPKSMLEWKLNEKLEKILDLYENLMVKLVLIR